MGRYEIALGAQRHVYLRHFPHIKVRREQMAQPRGGALLGLSFTWIPGLAPRAEEVLGKYLLMTAV